MFKQTIRLAAVAVLAGLVLQSFVADAGLRRLRVFRSNCAIPSCAVPSCAGCSAPLGCQGPYGQIGGCFAPSYVVAPPMVSACSGPSCFQPSCAFGSTCAGPNMSMFVDPYYGSAFVGSDYGAMGLSGSGASPASYFGGLNYGTVAAMPPYYAPVPAQYTPVPPAPPSDLVW